MVKTCVVPTGLGVFTLSSAPLCIGAVSVVTLVGFTQIQNAAAEISINRTWQVVSLR